MICQICNEEYDNTKSGIGKFYMHLKKAHQVSKKDYITQYEHGGVAPTCFCGCGEESNWSNRKGYTKYAKGHDRYAHREKQFVKKNGISLCSNDGCDNPVIFHRGEPTSYCSKRCMGKNTGWSLDKTQVAVKNTLMAKYGVSNSFQIDEVVDHIAKLNMSRDYKPLSSKTKEKISKAMKKYWQENFEFQSMSTREGIHNSDVHSKVSSARMKRNMQDTKYLENLWKNHSNRLSKLHQRVRDELCLQDKGFVSEQRIGRYIVDELNPRTKEVIEINGDYVHANPEIYQATDIITLRGNSYTAEDKWRKDREKIQWLESQGYTVTVIWENKFL